MLQPKFPSYTFLLANKQKNLYYISLSLPNKFQNMSNSTVPYNNNLTIYYLLNILIFNCRFVVATRKITGGEIIFKEEPILIGPRLDPNVLPMCSGCFGKLKKINYK